MGNRRTWAAVILVVVILALSIAACALLWRAAGSAGTTSVGFGEAVGVIPVEGVIASGFPDSMSSSGGTVYSGRVIEYLKQAEGRLIRQGDCAARRLSWGRRGGIG